MSNKTKFNTKNKENDDFKKEVAYQLIESALINGTITEEDFLNKKLLLKKVMNSIPKKDEDLYFKIIHHYNILKRAKQFTKEKDWNLVYMFYATYFEHLINEIINVWCIKNNISDKGFKELIRRVNLEDKFTWLLEILKLPTFNENHWATIKKISDKRNSYVHYKYPSEVAGKSLDADEIEWKKVKKNITKAVTYSKKYRNKVVINGVDKKIKSLLK